MRKVILFITAFGVTIVGVISTAAQTPEKKAEEKSKTSTIDIWREALPHAQANAMPEIVIAESTENVEAPETPAQIEKRILEMESRLNEAIKLKDIDTLRLLIADDLLIAGLELPGKQPDKERFIDWAKNKLDVKSYTLDSPSVRIFSRTAVITYRIKRQAALSGVAADGDFTVTDVWVQRQKRWQAVSHHISPTKL